MVAWPLYAEQRFNRVMMVEEMKIALPMQETENGFVTALEVERRVNELMQSESGNFARKRTIAMKNEAKAALSEGGSSRVVLSRLVESWKRYIESDCIEVMEALRNLVNTFELLEVRALKAISDGLCIPNSNTPPVYCIGPLIMTKNQTDGVTECLTWLDSQPSQSVIFLCFGSLGLFSKEQLREIAIGLERSGQRFLWVVRNPPSNSQRLAISAQPDPDLNSLLPDGFLDRTKERGLVVKLWAPQVAVLNHNSVGGFVTHCGWNSVLEAVCAGVPMVAWPLYAEQRINRVLLVEEMKVALPMNESENGYVTALEVEKRVIELMESESGKSVRERTIAMKNAAKEALSEGGSSFVGLSRLAESWNRQ
ncbi:hypothetical protein GH714_017988 [Hevea brasiliensis]|uniref:anthocyanidin 3-O-glucosyltransferase n=1 Tax=Hevea brasiliensis TaxID=3981 RepID=A0A6A6N1X7_HEVBR|nr:hypothetical protein GH714_017988 [Hevea brasiliensis]